MKIGISLLSSLIGVFFVAGCATVSDTPPKASAGKSSPMTAEEMTQAETVPEAVEVVDPCAASLEMAVAQARKTMKTAKGTCDGKKIEVNPMWSMNYDGTVHVRVYDAAGKLVQDTMQKP